MGAWEEMDNSCEAESIHDCDYEFATTSDALCECAPSDSPSANAAEAGTASHSERQLNIELTNILPGNNWPVVAVYDAHTETLSLMGNITWMGGSKSKVSLESSTCASAPTH